MALTAADIRRVCKTARLYAQVKPNVRLRWSATALSHFPAQRQYVSRLFMPDTSPTSIAWSIGMALEVLHQLDMDVEDSEFSVGRLDDNGEWHPA